MYVSMRFKTISLFKQFLKHLSNESKDILKIEIAHCALLLMYRKIAHTQKDNFTRQNVYRCTHLQQTQLSPQFPKTTIS